MTAAPTPSQRESTPALERFAPWILIAAGLLAYANSFSVPFLFDDIPTIVANPSIRRLWPPWDLLFYEGASDIGTSGRPVATVSFALNYATFGLRVAGYHALNLAIHLATALLFLGLVRRTLRLPILRERFASSANAIAFAATLLWAVHPLQTKSVTFIAQRLESMAACFYVLTLYAFLRAATGARAGRWLSISVLAAALGMATKETVASVPIAALLFDATFLTGSWRETFRSRWKWHLALAATWIVLLALLLSTARLHVAVASVSALSPLDYLKTQSWAIWHYVRLFAWPAPLVFDYGIAGDSVRVLREPREYLPYAAPLVLALAATLWGVVKLRPAAFLAATFFLILAPSSSVVPIRLDIVAEHRAYLPLAVLLTSVAIGVAWCLRRTARQRTALFVGALVLAVPLAWCTHQRNEDYASDLAIWTDTVQKLPGSARAQTNLGIALFDRGEYDAAIARHEESIRLRPDYSEAYHNLASALMYLERWPEAQEQYEKALALEPNAWSSHLGLAEALLAQGKHDAAAESFAAALRRHAEIPSAYLRLGAIRQMQGRADEAIRLYEESLRRAPNDVTVLNQLGLAYAQSGRFDFAADRFMRALRIDPKHEQARANLERVRAAAGSK